jgi:hypothetical protein
MILYTGEAIIWITKPIRPITTIFLGVSREEFISFIALQPGRGVTDLSKTEFERGIKSNADQSNGNDVTNVEIYHDLNPYVL